MRKNTATAVRSFWRYAPQEAGLQRRLSELEVYVLAGQGGFEHSVIPTDDIRGCAGLSHWLKSGSRRVQPLKRGGVDNASNVQWQTIEAAKIKISARVLPQPLRQVQGPMPPGGSGRCWEACGEHGIAVSTPSLPNQFADAGRLRSGDLPGEGDMGRSMGRIFMNSKLLYHSIA